MHVCVRVCLSVCVSVCLFPDSHASLVEEQDKVRHELLRSVGNILHPSVPISDNEVCVGVCVCVLGRCLYLSLSPARSL